jgi:predicted TIM-barrel fold metal-dependent hydrolase
MIDNDIVVDAVGHCYNFDPSNYADPLAVGFSQGSLGFHGLLTPPGPYVQDADSYLVDWSAEDLENVYKYETDVDVVCYHGVPLDDYFHDGFVDFKKGVEMRERNPGRVFLFGPINPLETNHAIEAIDRYADLGCVGLKLYPARYFNGRSIPVRLDDTDYAVPIIERALEKGITTVAVHKAMPFGGTALAEYRVDDVDFAAAMYPEMRFEIVHAGYAFLEDTFMQLGRFPNVYANLECTASLAAVRPRRFAEIIGNMLYVGGADRILFATGCCLVHPQPAIDALMSFEMPQDMLDDGLPDLTMETKKKILGGNFLKMHDIDETKLRSEIAGDSWETAERKDPYHAMTAHTKSEVTTAGPSATAEAAR